MRTLQQITVVFIGAQLLTGCLFPKIEVREPEEKANQQSAKAEHSCSVAEDKLVIPEGEDILRREFELKIPTQKIEAVNCEGQVADQKKGPAQFIEEKVLIVPPELAKKVGFVKVVNERTCSERVYSVESADLSLTLTAPEKQSPGPKSQLFHNGILNLAVSDRPAIENNHVVVQDGLNVLHITYLGKCANDAQADCTEELAKKSAVLNFKVERPQTEDTQKIDSCAK